MRRITARTRFLGLPTGLFAGLWLMILLVAAGVTAPWISPHDPVEQHLEKRLSPPCPEFLLGTDALGRCVASRLIYGIRPSVGISLSVTALVAAVGMAVGMLSAYYRALDNIMMRVTDCFFAFPAIVLALVMIAILGPGIKSLVIALAVPGWPKYARVVRSVALSVKERGFVEATRAIGGRNTYILCRCMLPAVWAPVMTIATVGMGGKVIHIASLGFLGLGVQPPTPEWGTILNQGLPFLGIAPHISLSAGAFIMITVLSFTLVGEGLREAADAKHNAPAMEQLLKVQIP
jgi:ABC-type dipeptide/oligopeptide/nickel transport system permease subunit